MRWVDIFVISVLLLGFFPATAGTQKVDMKAVTAGKVNAANSLQEGMPTASVSSQVTYFDSGKVAAASAPDAREIPGKSANRYGGVLLDWPGGENRYQVRITRQEKPGLAEIHTTITQIFYILEGTAMFVTGGTVVEPRAIEPITPWGGKEIRGTAIEGGEAHHLSKGDVIIVPFGVPHWLKEVQGPFIYYAVNLR